VPRLCKALASFARSRLGVHALHPGTVPFMFAANAPLAGGWLGGSSSDNPQAQSDEPRVATPLQKTSDQVESLRKALQLRKSANVVKTPDGASQSALRSPQLQPREFPNYLALPSQIPGEMRRGHLEPSSSAAAASTSQSAGAGVLSQRDVLQDHGAHALMAPTRWMKDEDAPRCCDCNAAFTMLNRRHHCRVCGRIVDSRCCSKFHINKAHFRHSESDTERFHQIVELVCYPCQTDIERGATTEQAACNRADANSSPSVRDHSLRAFDSGANHVSADAQQHGLHARHHEHGAATRDHVRSVSFAPLHSAAGPNLKMRVESDENGDSAGPGLQRDLMTRPKTAFRARRHATVTAPPDTSPDMQLSDLRQDVSHSWPAAAQPDAHAAAAQPDAHAALTHLSTRILQPKHPPAVAAGQRLPSRASRGGVQHHEHHQQASPPLGDLRDGVPLRDQLETAYSVLDRTMADCDDPALASLVADRVYFDHFLGWAEMSLGLPSEVAAVAADAAYQQTHGTCKQAMHNVATNPRPGVPRSLFPMLLLNLKLELKKQDIRLHAENLLCSPTYTQKSLPSRIKSGAAALQLGQKADAWSNSATYTSAPQGRRTRVASQVGTAVREIESLLQSSGFRPEECQKVAVELASAGARDMRSIVQLLQQDNITLSKAGLQPSHLLRVLRNMAKQPAFAADAPSFRLTLEDD
jgi:hypothetical protein